MSLRQPDEKPALGDFFTWFNSAKIMGVTDLLQPNGPPPLPARLGSAASSPGSNSPSTAETGSPSRAPPSAREVLLALHETSPYFIPDNRVKEHFTPERIGKILRELWPDNLQVQESDIEAEYSKIFCILLRIGRGHFIEGFVQHESLHDDKLPFTCKPKNFPPADDEFFPEFFRVQWMFCAPVFRQKIHQKFEKDYVLPITCKEDLARGATATTSKIVLHETYNKLDMNSKARRDSHLEHNFVLKTYCTRDAEEHYGTEVRAYRKLRPNNDQSGIIRFYGSFVHDGTFNILLEYADRGTLNHYFDQVTPPSTTEDIIDYWKAMFDLIQGILTIHNAQRANELDEDGKASFRGWHQDVKPDNILVASGSRKSDFGCQFKLADLGLCHFTKVRSQDQGKYTLSQNEQPADRDAFGTRTYGAPECYRSDDFIANSRLLVDQSVDIWSLGCIYSEAAVWVLQGREHLEAYRKRRTRETDEKYIKDTGCFHDGTNVLDCVERTHFKALGSKRACDYITEDVLKLVEEMLGNKDLRPNAKQLWEKSKLLIRKAEKATQRAKRQHTGSSSRIEPKTPPLAPVPSTSSNPGSRRPTGLSFRQNTHSSQQSDSLWRTGLQIQPCVSSFEIPGIQRCDSPSQQTTVDEYDTQKFPANESIVLERPTDAYERAQSSPAGVQQVNRPTIDSLVNSSGTDLATHFMTPTTLTERLNKPLPKLAVQEVQRWIIEKKTSSNNIVNQWKSIGNIGKSRGHSDLPDEQFLQQLKNRDHVFLVDDSNSMEKYWKDVKIVFSTLCYMVKNFDKDGVDLHFTRHLSMFNSGKSTELSQLLDKCKKLDAPSNMEKSLEKILEKHKENLHTLSKQRSRLVVKKKVPRPMNLYVFTDGAWHNDCDAAAPIRDFIAHYHTRWGGDPPGGFSGIQFISFGNDTASLEYLKHLDSGLDLTKDIVDTEPSDGNVWKMLLGAINPLFDNDPAWSTRRSTLELSNPPSFAKSV